MSPSLSQAPPEVCSADYSRDHHNLLFWWVESRRHPIQKLNCAACETLGSGVALALGVAQLRFDQVIDTYLTQTGGTRTAPETALPEKPSVFIGGHCPPDAPSVRTKRE
jgi:hypothetical protein